MANIGVSAIKLIDSDGDALDDGNGKLNVNATLVAGASIDIGDVEIKGHAAIADGRGRAPDATNPIIAVVESDEDCQRRVHPIAPKNIQ